MRPPNLLFLFTDEQRFDTLACYGNERIDMPNLNRLAGSATVFRRAYVTQAVCTPSRSSLMTGLYPHTSGCVANNIPLPEEVPCLPEMLPEGLYRTAYMGKWHLGDEIFAQHGFETWESIEDMYARHYSPDRDRRARSSYHHWLIDNGLTPENGEVFGRREAARLPEEYSKPAFLGTKASQFIRRHRDEPFCLYVNFLEPHMPFFGPRDGQYDPETVPLPSNFDAVDPENEPPRVRQKRRCIAAGKGTDLHEDTEPGWRDLISRYWGMCSHVDSSCGQILQTLESCGLADNTIVVFTSDHGDMMGGHRLLAKTVQFEESVRVPLLVRLPGQQTQHVVEGPISQIDVVPTLLELMGQDIPAGLEGVSRADVVRRDRPMGNDDVFLEWNRDNGLSPAGEPGEENDLELARRDWVRTVVTPDGWKFCFSPVGAHQLFDLNADPEERINLAGRAEHRARMEDLAARIRRWQERTGDTVDLGELA